MNARERIPVEGSLGTRPFASPSNGLGNALYTTCTLECKFG